MRRTLLVLSAILGLGLVCLVAVFAFAHQQIRGVDPPIPAIEILLEAVDRDDLPVSVAYVNTVEQLYADGRLFGSPGFVLEWADGRRFLIDVGMDEATSIEFGAAAELAFGAGPAKPIATVASQLGTASDSIQGLAFTHLHHDHTQGVVALCERLRRPLPIFQTPDQFEKRNHTTEMGFEFVRQARALPGAQGCGTPTRLERDPGSMSASVFPIRGFPGLVAIAAGGHTPGSTLFFARMQDGRSFLFSGDITNSRKDFVENLPKAKLYSAVIVPEYPDRLERLRVWLAAQDKRPDVTVVVSHDLSALRKIRISEWADRVSRR